MFANTVYAFLAAQCPDGETRRKLDDELYAPPGGQDMIRRRLLAAAGGED